MAFSILVAGCAGTATPLTSADSREGYLSGSQIQELADAIPAPAPPGSPQALADAALSNRYRTLEDSDRWLLATAHAELSPELARQHFDCALGVRFAGAPPTPRLTILFQRLLHDANGAAELAKARAFRARPVGDDPSRPACVRLTPAARSSASYPSGSAAVGAAYGEALALVAPDRAAAVRRIGHEVGVSRVVCAMHYPADVAAGEALGLAVAAEADETPAFRDDIVAARAELTQVRATGLTNPGCVAERAALSALLPNPHL